MKKNERLNRKKEEKNGKEKGGGAGERERRGRTYLFWTEARSKPDHGGWLETFEEKKEKGKRKERSH